MATRRTAGRRETLFPVSDLLLLLTGVVLAISQFYGGQGVGGGPPASRFLLRIVSVLLIFWGLRQPQIWLLSRILPGNWRPVARHRVLLPIQGIVYLVMMLIMAIGSLLGHSNMLMLMFSMMAGPFVLNGWVVFSMLKRMTMTRQIPRRATAGQSVSVGITLENRKHWLSSRLILVEDRIYNQRESLKGTILFVRVPPRAKRTGRYHVTLMQRGRYSFGPISISSTFPLGLGQRGMEFSQSDELLVHPRIGRVHSHWMNRTANAELLVQRQQTRSGAFDDEFHRIREYRQGDNPRGIHWRSSARRNELMVKEFHQSRDYDLTVLLDLWLPPKPRDEELLRLELAVSFVATLALEHLRNCREATFSLILPEPDQSLLRLNSGQAAVDLLLDCLAEIEGQSNPDTGSLIERLSVESQGGQRIILVTTRTAEDDDRGDGTISVPTGNEWIGEIEVVRSDWTSLSEFFVLE